MTWEEFKNYIDQKFRDTNVNKNLPIEYIAISHPCFTHDSCIPDLYWDDDSIAIHN